MEIMAIMAVKIESRKPNIAKNPAKGMGEMERNVYFIEVCFSLLSIQPPDPFALALSR